MNHDDCMLTEELIRSALCAIEPVWLEYEWIGLRLQTSVEAKRTKVGCTLRPSSEWVDGTKSSRKLSGTAAFQIRSLDQIQSVVESMARSGYSASLATERLVVIGSNDGVNGADMPERNAAAFKNAILLAVIA